MFIFRIKNKLDNWIVPKRISDNMTKMEREGMEEVKKDNDHTYKMEDKGSCIVRLKKTDYENNVKTELDTEIKDTTAEVIIAKTNDTN